MCSLQSVSEANFGIYPSEKLEDGFVTNIISQNNTTDNCSNATFVQMHHANQDVVQENCSWLLENQLIHLDNQPFPGVGPETKNRKSDITRNRTIKKKCKRVRTAFTTEQVRALEKSFIQHKYINSENRWQLSKDLNIAEKCIKIWFQNRRMKEKRESSESSDTLSEISQEIPSPPLSRPEVEIENGESHHQYTLNNSMYYYQMPANNVCMFDEVQGQVYVPQQTVTPNDYFTNGVNFFNENPYTSQFSTGSETYYQENFYQNQCQYNNDYNYWCNNTLDNNY